MEVTPYIRILQALVQLLESFSIQVFFVPLSAVSAQVAVCEPCNELNEALQCGSLLALASELCGSELYASELSISDFCGVIPLIDCNSVVGGSSCSCCGWEGEGLLLDRSPVLEG